MPGAASPAPQGPPPQQYPSGPPPQYPPRVNPRGTYAAPGQPTGAPPTPPAGRLSRRKKAFAWIAAGALGVAAVAGGIQGARSIIDDANDLLAGNCLVISEGTENLEHHRVECDDDTEFSYLVTEYIDGDGACTDDEALSYTVTTTSLGARDSVESVSCIIPNFRPGLCYLETDAELYEYRIVDCREADFRVAAAENAPNLPCDFPAEAWQFPRSNRSYCLAPPG